MTQRIDPIRLKAAAEHLEWVLRQYPNSEEVQRLLDGMMPLIESAKAHRVTEPVERMPYEYAFADGLYVQFKEPDVGDAYAQFANEMEGGLAERDIRRQARLRALWESKSAKYS